VVSTLIFETQEQPRLTLIQGAVGVEMAAETAMVYPNLKTSLIHSRSQLLSSEPLPEEFRDKTLELLREGGVNVVLGKRVLSTTPSDQNPSKTILNLSDNTTMTASHICWAISAPKPTTSYLPSSTLNSDGEVTVVSTLHFPHDTPHSQSHLAIGDIVVWPPKGTHSDNPAALVPAIKRCGNALYMGQIAAWNIHQDILLQRGLVKDAKYKEFPIFVPGIAVALGKSAVGYSDHMGVTWGEQVRQTMFEDDLGLGICWRSLGLAEPVKEK
jgi:NADH dehydrogenase FAD-containing subunit